MITMSSAIVTLVIGIGTFFIGNIEAQKEVYSNISITILLLGIVLAIISILFFIRSYTIRDYLILMQIGTISLEGDRNDILN